MLCLFDNLIFESFHLVDFYPQRGNTALLQASRAGNTELVKLLMSLNAAPDSTNKVTFFVVAFVR